MKSVFRASVVCVIALLALPPAAPASADSDNTALTNLISLVSQRLALAEPVARWKWLNHQPITDAQWERRLLADVQKRAAAAGVDPSFAHAFFADQIEANSQIQQALFDSWRASRAPVAQAPDLTTVTRPQLMRLTPQMIAGLARVQSVRAEPDCPARVAQSLADWKSLTRYDSTRSDALNRALSHICESGGVGGVA